jgi:Pyridoxamine 5'-phosphate oxidase
VEGQPPAGRRPSLPIEYGLQGATAQPGARLPWSTVRTRLVEARTYWVVTTRPDGRPHAVPVWGVWDDSGLAFSTGAPTVTARNLAANPAALAHLDDGDRAVIVEGAAAPVTARDALVTFAAAYTPKYDYAIDPDALPGPVHLIRPRTVLSWDAADDLAETATRWEFRPWSETA